MGEYADEAINRMIDGSWGWRGGRSRARRRDPELGAMRIKAHQAFDPLWQDGKMTRSQAYAWLADQMGIPIECCHMEQMNKRQCERVIEICGPLAFENLDDPLP